MRVTTRRAAVQMDHEGRRSARAELLAGEEPLEIRVQGSPYTVTMRTPGHDFELVAGFLLSEGLVWQVDHVRHVRYGRGVNADGTASYNIVEAELAPSAQSFGQDGQNGQDGFNHVPLARSVYTSSACGLCGTATIDAVTRVSHYPPTQTTPTQTTGGAVRDWSGSGTDPNLDLVVSPAALAALPDQLRAGQRVFTQTGGVHAAGLFALPAAADGANPAQASGQGELQPVCVREDVGRHNAVDKVLGWALFHDVLPLRRAVLQVSGRASFELIQKASMAGIPVLAAVGAPSNAAADLADQLGMTLVGFSRGGRFTVYTGAHRVG